MAHISTPFPKIIFVIIGLMLDKVGCSTPAPAPLLADDTRSINEDKRLKQQPSTYLESWSQRQRNIAIENTLLLSLPSSRKEQRDIIDFYKRSRYPNVGRTSIPIDPKTVQTHGGKFKHFLTFPEGSENQDDAEELSMQLDPSRRRETPSILSQSTGGVATGLGTIMNKAQRHTSGHSHNKSRKCRHNLDNQSMPVSNASSSFGNIRSGRPTQETRRHNRKRRSSEYSYTTNQRSLPRSGSGFRTDTIDHQVNTLSSLAHKQTRVDEIVVGDVDNESNLNGAMESTLHGAMESTLNGAPSNRQTEEIRLAEFYNDTSLQRNENNNFKPSAIVEFNSSQDKNQHDDEAANISYSSSTISQEEGFSGRDSDRKLLSSGNGSKGDETVSPYPQRSSHSSKSHHLQFMHGFVSHSRRHKSPHSSHAHHTIISHPLLTTHGGDADFRSVSDHPQDANVTSSTSVTRKLRRRRWGQRPDRPQSSPIGRSRSPIGRSRSPIGGSRSSIGRSRSPIGRSRSPSSLQTNAFPDAQTVSLKVIVEIRVSRGYHRILESAIRKGIRQSDFQPMLKFVNPTGKLVRIRHDQPRDILKAFCDDILENGTTAVVQLINPFFHTRSWSSAQYIANLLATLSMPVITWGPEYIGASDKTESEQTQLTISPTLHHQARAILDVLGHYHWSAFAVVYTQIPGHETFLSALRVLVKKKHRGEDKTRESIKFGILNEVKVSNVSSPASIREDLKSLTETEVRIILLYCNEGETLTILDGANKLGLLDKEYVWVLTFEAINKNKRQNANNLPLGLLGLQYTYREEAMKDAIETAVSLWLHGIQQSLLSTANGTGTPTGLPWSVPGVQCQSSQDLLWEDGKTFFGYLKNASYEDVSFTRIGQLESTVISLYNVQYDHDDNTQKKWMEVGKWTGDRVTIQQITWPKGERVPPRGKPERHYLRIVTREEPPFVIYGDLNFNGTCDAFSCPCAVYERDENETRLANSTITKCCTGVSIDLLRKLSSALDFDFYLYEVEDFQWGTKTESGQWDGIVGEVRSGRADMAVASMTIDEDKSAAVNFSFPYMETGITFIVAIRDGAISATAFLEPYDYPSWCLILLCSVHVTGASIFLFEWISPYGLDYGNRMSNKYKFSLFRSFWLMWAMLFGAAVSTDTPRGVSSKFTSNIWALFALVFTASYTANLAAFMITKEEYYNLSGMQDWRLQHPYAVNPPFRFGTVPNSTAESNIKKNNPSMNRYMKQYSQISVEHAMEALKAQNLEAFIYDASVLEYQEGKDKDCQLITVGNWYATTGYGVAFPPGSRWLSRVNSVILDLHYEGEMERLKEFWLAGACHTKRKKATHNSRGIGNGVSSTTLGILNFTSAFIFLAAGTGLAAIVFAMEHCLFWLGRKKLSAWDKKGCCALISLSMGWTMSFRDSVKEAMEAHRKATIICRCKNAICETHLWKANFQLKQARREIEELHLTLSDLRSKDKSRPADLTSPICINNRSQREVGVRSQDKVTKSSQARLTNEDGHHHRHDDDGDDDDDDQNEQVTFL